MENRQGKFYQTLDNELGEGYNNDIGVFFHKKHSFAEKLLIKFKGNNA